MSHTPGPWTVEDRRKIHPSLGPNGPGLLVTAAHRGPGSSFCVANINHWEDAGANARLVASAPDLLETLKEARAYVLLLADHYSHGPAEVFVDKIDAAIAKATA